MISQQVTNRDTPKPGEKWQYCNHGTTFVVVGLAYYLHPDNKYVVYSREPCDSLASKAIYDTESDQVFYVPYVPIRENLKVETLELKLTSMLRTSRTKATNSMLWTRPSTTSWAS